MARKFSAGKESTLMEVLEYFQKVSEPLMIFPAPAWKC